MAVYNDVNVIAISHEPGKASYRFLEYGKIDGSIEGIVQSVEQSHDEGFESGDTHRILGYKRGGEKIFKGWSTFRLSKVF